MHGGGSAALFEWRFSNVTKKDLCPLFQKLHESLWPDCAPELDTATAISTINTRSGFDRFSDDLKPPAYSNAAFEIKDEEWKRVVCIPIDFTTTFIHMPVTFSYFLFQSMTVMFEIIAVALLTAFSELNFIRAPVRLNCQACFVEASRRVL